ncbi:MAG TPA: TonB family protein [Allosphingosinicella sp.]
MSGGCELSISILAAALLVQPAPDSVPAASSPQWTLAATNEDGEYWIDRASVRQEGAVHRFRARIRIGEAVRDEVRSAVIAYQLDCARQTIAIESLEAFDAAGETVATRTVPSLWLDKDPIDSGSFLANFYARICPAPRRALVERPPPPRVMMVAPPIAVAPPPPILRAAPPPAPPPPPRPGDPVRRATPVVPLPSLFSADDYPAAALRAEEEGVVGYRMAIDREGRVVGCDITSSSGSASLDSTTCRLIRARARFRPARTAKGKKTADVIHGRIWWRFPEEPAPIQTEPAQ